MNLNFKVLEWIEVYLLSRRERAGYYHLARWDLDMSHTRIIVNLSCLCHYSQVLSRFVHSNHTSCPCRILLGFARIQVCPGECYSATFLAVALGGAVPECAAQSCVALRQSLTPPKASRSLAFDLQNGNSKRVYLTGKFVMNIKWNNIGNC